MTGKSTKRTRRKYDASFKEDVLKMIASGRSVPDVAQALGVGTNLIYRWINIAQTNQSGLSGNSHNQTNSIDFSAENERLKAELRRAEQERDILIKALGIFSRGT
jgi:transposase